MTQVRLSPSDLQPQPSDRELFDRLLRDFVPEKIFDSHAHLYRADDLPASFAMAAHSEVGLSCYRRQMSDWMGDRAPRDGLFFGLPERAVDLGGANEFCLTEIAKNAKSRALLMIAPTDDPAAVESQIAANVSIAGFKVYHVFAERTDTMNAKIEEFLPEWAWELADRRGLLIMLHLVRPRALADLDNRQSIRTLCQRYPNARLVLAHAARGFCSHHTLDGLNALAGLDNVWLDTSAICEAAPLVAILQACGPRRLLFGSDYPVSNLVGRCSSLGDGFAWFYQHNVQWSAAEIEQRTLVGNESLLALRQACLLAHLTPGDVEDVFRNNACQLLDISEHDAQWRFQPAPNPTEPCPDESRPSQLPQVESGRWQPGLTGQQLYAKSRKLMPGGTQLLSKRPEMHAPDRWPPYFAEARGVQVVDVDGRGFVDMATMSVGTCLLGYADRDVNAAVQRRVQLGAMSSLNCPDEVELAEQLLALHPWAARVRYARGGGEALAIAIRIARASTGRSKVAFCGYHGWQDWYLAANLADSAESVTVRSSGVADGALYDRLSGHLLPGLEPAGVPHELAGTALPFAYNRPEQLAAIVAKHGTELAAIVMEPTRHEWPDPGFLPAVRAQADRCGAVLVFDEVSVGWRLCLGGAHLALGAVPDLAVYSKALANGFPMAAILGVESVMQAAQRSFISSTMWTDGVGPAAALATLRQLQQHDVPTHVATIGEYFRQSMQAAAASCDIEIGFQGPPALSKLSFAHPEGSALQTLLTARMLERGFLLGAAFYPSYAHQVRHVDACAAVAQEVFRELRQAIRSGDVAAHLPCPIKHSRFHRLA